MHEVSAGENGTALTYAMERALPTGRAVNQLEIVPRLSGEQLGARAVAGGLALEVPLAGSINVDAERARLKKELEKVQDQVESLERKLSNASFVDRAPKEVVEENRRRLAHYQNQAAKLAEGLKRLGN